MPTIKLTSTVPATESPTASVEMFVDLLAEIFTEKILENEECNRLRSDIHRRPK